MFGDQPAPLGHANLDDVEADRKRMSSKKAAGNGCKALEPLLLIGEIPANHYLTHKPKHPKCIVCNACKTIHKRLTRSIEAQKDEWDKKVTKFGDLVTCDHLVLGSGESASRHGDRVSLVCKDRKTKWIDAFPNAHKNAAASVEALQEFAGTDPIDILYSDGSHELTKAVKDIRTAAVEQASALIGIKHHKAT